MYQGDINASYAAATFFLSLKLSAYFSVADSV